jgi:hypothetical protein
MKSIILHWMSTPGPTGSVTAEQILRGIEERWGTGEPIREEMISGIRKELLELVEEGLVQLDKEPHFIVPTPHTDGIIGSDDEEEG